MGWLDVVNWNLETIKKMSFCNFNTAVWNCRVRLWTNFLLITFDFGVNTNFISDCRVQISVCKDPVMGEYVCVVERFTESFSGEAGEGRKYWNPQTPWPWLPHSGVTKGTGPGRLRAGLPLRGSWWQLVLSLLSFLWRCFFFASSEPKFPCPALFKPFNLQMWVEYSCSLQNVSPQGNFFVGHRLNFVGLADILNTPWAKKAFVWTQGASCDSSFCLYGICIFASHRISPSIIRYWPNWTFFMSPVCYLC